MAEAEFTLQIDQDWTLFLDRDGVINQKLDNDYVKSVEEFNFLEGVPEALKSLAGIFPRIVIVTNQQGIGKGLMTEDQLLEVHGNMLRDISEAGGRIDEIYFCPDLAGEDVPRRKPNIGMAMDALADFPDIDFKKSIIVGDSPSDMEFGLRAGMTRIFITRDDASRVEEGTPISEAIFANLPAFAAAISDQIKS